MKTNQPDSNIENMDIKEIAETIGNAIGVSFKTSGFGIEYEANLKNEIKLWLSKLQYSCDGVSAKKGDAFIRCRWTHGISGAIAPADSIVEAIEWFKEYLDLWKERGLI